MRRKRLDHHAMYIWVIGGLVPLTGTMIDLGPLPYGSGLTNRTQVLLVTCVLGGALICVIGMCVGTRWFVPKADARLPFALAISGGLGVWFGLLAYIILLAATDPPHWLIVLLINFGLYVSFGTLHGIIDFVRAMRTQEHSDDHSDS